MKRWLHAHPNWAMVLCFMAAALNLYGMSRYEPWSASWLPNAFGVVWWGLWGMWWYDRTGGDS